jgi:hypothetical protein
MKNLLTIKAPLALSLIALTACAIPAHEHHASLHSSKERDVTVGTVQAKITRGMAAADVAEALGSPNIVTKDSGGDETWIYDKVATEASYSNDSGNSGGGLGAGGTPGVALILGGLFGSHQRDAGASARMQRTLTVVIKYDNRSRVKDFSYHSSKF